ncbi:hypothetical protein [Actinosynnema sp. NPDC020468]|uniref:hypothetical protein n=1 Tax=Actinosynnema sp. NPDC020468 TaxID=3154488 RepID=UPI003408351C
MIEGVQTAAHGVALVERVIESVRREPGRSMYDYLDVPWVSGPPTPGDGAAVFPSGRPLSPSLRAWLAFDRSLFARHGWFTPSGALAPRRLDALVGDELGPPWGELFEPVADRFPECFLLPGGSDSRRVLAVGEPDSTGEYPVLAVDVDDLPFVGLMYPGFDVYVAHEAGLVEHPFESYTDLVDDPVYRPRMREHARHRFAGDVCFEYPF